MAESRASCFSGVEFTGNTTGHGAVKDYKEASGLIFVSVLTKVHWTDFFSVVVLVKGYSE